MRKALWMIAILLGLAVYASHNQNPSHQQEGQTKPAEVAPASPDKPQPPQQTPQRQEEMSWIDRLLLWPEGVGALAVILTLGAIVWQSDETRNSAKATLHGIEATKTKERAKFLIKPKHKEFGIGDHPTALITVHNVGESKALIGQALGGLYFSDSEDIIAGESEGYYWLKINDRAMAADETSSEEIFWPGHALDRHLQENDGLYVHLHGYIRYRDAFEEEWVCRFHYVWIDYRTEIYIRNTGMVSGAWDNILTRTERVETPSIWRVRWNKARQAWRICAAWAEKIEAVEESQNPD